MAANDDAAASKIQMAWRKYRVATGFCIKLKSKDLAGITAFKVNMGDCIFTADDTIKHFPEAVLASFVTGLSSEGCCQLLPFLSDGAVIDCGDKCARLDINDPAYHRPKPGKTLLYHCFVHELRLQQRDAEATLEDKSKIQDKETPVRASVSRLD